MNRLVVLWVLFLIAVGTGVAGGRAPAPLPAAERDEFFRKPQVVHLAIDLTKENYRALQGDPRKYVRARLTETTADGDEIVYEDVGIHLKGAAGSFRPVNDKPGLTLNMDKYSDGQRFHGMDKFHLANSVQDPSYLSELICGELFRAAGVPAARVSHAVVTINGKLRGFYYLKEGYDKGFLRHHFGNADGNFYDGGFLRDVDQPLQLISSKGDVPNHADLKALTAAAREPDREKRLQKLEKLLDLDKFLTYSALEAVVWDWDGYPFNRNNYRIYHDPKRDKVTFLPSGMDQMFGNPNGEALPGFQGLVAKAIIDTPKGKERYYAKMAELLKTTFVPADLVKRLDELQKQLQPALAEIDKNAGRDYPNHVNRLKQAIPQRFKSIDEQLKKRKK